MKTYTTIEQSKKLLELGLDPNTADMYYQYVLPHSNSIHHVPQVGNPVECLNWYNKGYTISGKEALSIDDYCIPAWSLAALLELMPSVIKRCNKRMFLSLDKAGAFNLYYKSPDRLDEIWFTKENPIDAVFDMLCWLLENNYIKTKSKQ